MEPVGSLEQSADTSNDLRNPGHPVNYVMEKVIRELRFIYLFHVILVIMVFLRLFASCKRITPLGLPLPSSSPFLYPIPLATSHSLSDISHLASRLLIHYVLNLNRINKHQHKQR